MIFVKIDRDEQKKGDDTKMKNFVFYENVHSANELSVCRINLAFAIVLLDLLIRVTIWLSL